MDKSLAKKSKNKKVQINVLNNQYITNYDVWTFDETYLSKQYGLLVVINLKTRAILGYTLKKLQEEEQNQVVVNKKNNQKYSKILNSEEVKELFETLFDQGFKPVTIHSDNSPVYTAAVVVKLFKKHGIQVSRTHEFKRSNQVSEAINNSIKQRLIKKICQQKNKPYKEFTKRLPDNLKRLKITEKIKNQEYKNLFFESYFFNNNINLATQLEHIVQDYNSEKNKDISKEFSRHDMETYNQHIIPVEHKKASKDSYRSLNILEENNAHYQKVAQITDQISSHKELTSEVKDELIQDLNVVQTPTRLEEHLLHLRSMASEEQQPVIDTLLLTYESQKQYLEQNQQVNEELHQKLLKLEKLHTDATKMLQELTDYKNKIEEQERLKELAREKRKQRQRRAQTQPFTYDHYNQAIKEIDQLYKNNQTTRLKFRLLLTLFVITGVRISELRYVKVSQILTLLYKGHLPISRAKRGRANYKAYLSNSGHNLVNQNRDDFFTYLLLNSIRLPEEELKDYNVEPYESLYFFSSEQSDHKKPFNRAFNDSFNKLLQTLDVFKEQNLRFTSHLLRHGFITQMWKNSQDIEFVKQAIRHS